MKQHYFVVVLAHSLHGRLRRIHIPHQSIYVVLALALFGSVSLFGMVSSYLRMTWKVSNYNTLRSEADTLRNILLAWVLTLPICVILGAGIFSGFLFLLLHVFGMN